MKGKINNYDLQQTQRQWSTKYQILEGKWNLLNWIICFYLSVMDILILIKKMSVFLTHFNFFFPNVTLYLFVFTLCKSENII